MNAKEELIKHTEGKKILCAMIGFIDNWEIKPNILLKLNYTLEDFNCFLSKIDREYNDGWGTQELDGTIWYTDGTWSIRGEYDGSEWWEYVSKPEIPDELL